MKTSKQTYYEYVLHDYAPRFYQDMRMPKRNDIKGKGTKILWR